MSDTPEALAEKVRAGIMNIRGSDNKAIPALDALLARLAEVERNYRILATVSQGWEDKCKDAEAQITILKEGMDKDRIEAYGRGFQDGQTAKEAEIGFVMDAVMGRD